MSNPQYVLAYDVGTSGVKGVLVSLDGEILLAETESYPLYTPQPGWAEQVPEDYWRGVCKVTRALMAKSGVSPSAIAGLAFGSMWKGIIPIDRDGKVLHNSILWLDARAGDQARRLNERFGAGKFNAAAYWPKLMWLRENAPEVIENAEIILEVNSFLKWKATGQAAVDISNSFVRSFDPELEAFYEEFLSFIDIPQEKFPPIVHAYDLVGRITEDAAAELGLAPGIPIFGGCNDIQAVTVGSGCADLGGVHIYFGSSGWNGYTRPHRSSIIDSPFDETRDLKLFGLRAIGLSFNWAAETLYKSEWETLGGEVFPLIDREAAEIPPGSDGVLVAPWFYGEWPPLCGLDARGCFLNLAPQHDRRHLARATMEGICYHLRMLAELADKAGGCAWPEAFNAIGGGAGSDIWMQMLADIMNTPVNVPRAPRHAGAAGVACCALIGLGEYADYTEAAKHLQMAHRFEPQPEAVKVYEKNYAVFKQLYSMLRPVFEQMNTRKAED